MKALGKFYIDGYDPNTCQEIVWNPIETLPNGATLDNVMWFKKGTKKFERVCYEIDPRWYGAKADGVSDDTAALQKAADAANKSQKWLKLFFHKISGPLSFSCSVRQLIPAYAAGNLYGILATGSNYRAVTFNSGKWNSENLLVDSNYAAGVKGIHFNNAIQSTHSNARAIHCNGNGLLYTNCWDSIFISPTTEHCGTVDEHAFIVRGLDGDTTNMSSFVRPQVEQSNGKSMFIEPGTLCCVFSNIHCERTAGNYAEPTVSAFLGGNACTYINPRFHVEGSNHNIQITAAGTTVIDLRTETIVKVLLESYSNSVLNLIGGTINEIGEVVNQTNVITVTGMAISKHTGYSNAIRFDDCYISECAIDSTAVGSKVVYEDCNIALMKANAAGITRVKMIGGRIADVATLPQILELDNAELNKTTGPLLVAYSELIARNGSNINIGIRTDFGRLYISDTDIDGPLTTQGGPRIFLFSNASVNGAIDDFFSQMPDFPATAGLKSIDPKYGAIYQVENGEWKKHELSKKVPYNYVQGASANLDNLKTAQAFRLDNPAGVGGQYGGRTSYSGLVTGDQNRGWRIFRAFDQARTFLQGIVDNINQNARELLEVDYEPNEAPGTQFYRGVSTYISKLLPPVLAGDYEFGFNVGTKAPLWRKKTSGKAWQYERNEGGDVQIVENIATPLNAKIVISGAGVYVLNPYGGYYLLAAGERPVTVDYTNFIVISSSATLIIPLDFQGTGDLGAAYLHSVPITDALRPDVDIIGTFFKGRWTTSSGSLFHLQSSNELSPSQPTDIEFDDLLAAQMAGIMPFPNNFRVTDRLNLQITSKSASDFYPPLIFPAPAEVGSTLSDAIDTLIGTGWKICYVSDVEFLKNTVNVVARSAETGTPMRAVFHDNGTVTCENAY